MRVEPRGAGSSATGTGMGTELGQLLAVGSHLGPFHGLFINPNCSTFSSLSHFPAGLSGCLGSRAAPAQGGAGKAFTVSPCWIIQRDFFPSCVQQHENTRMMHIEKRNRES